MKRGIVYGITTAITFYMALLFESRSLLMIGILEVFIIIFALLYYLRLACRLRIEADAESMVNAVQDGYTIRFTVQNKSRLPINKMRIKVIEENVYAHQKQKAMVTLPVTAGIMKKDGQKEIIQVQTKWYPKDAGLYHIKVKRVFVSDWFGLLEFPLFRKNAKDVVEVLILPKKQPIVFEFNEERLKQNNLTQEQCFSVIDKVMNEYSVYANQPGTYIASDESGFNAFILFKSMECN